MTTGLSTGTVKLFVVEKRFPVLTLIRGLSAVAELKKICPENMSIVQFALRWILMFEEVSCAIPGAKTAEQANENFSVSEKPFLPMTKMDEVKAVYEQFICSLVHDRW